MARPIKSGLSYFPLDVDADYDDKIQLIEGLYGPIGFATVIKLYMKIYSSGYYYPWEEKEQILLAKRIGTDVNTLNNIVNECVKYELFQEKLFSEYKILTSEGIQIRFFTAVGKRKRGVVYREYLLIKEQELKEMCPSMTVEGIIQGKTTVNPGITPVIQESGTQSKVKKRKVKETKVKDNTEQEKPDPIPYAEITDYLNQQTGKSYKHAAEGHRKFIRARWNEGHRLDDFKQVIDVKTAEWKDDPKMNQYLQPSTLFGNKFDQYRNQKPKYQRPVDEMSQRIVEHAKASADEYLNRPDDGVDLPF